MANRDRTSAREEKAALRSLIEAHSGNLSAMARAEDTTRQTMTKRLADHGLAEAAAKARFAGGVSGARSGAVGPESDAAAKEKAKIEAALARWPSAVKAAQKLGITRSALYRKIESYGIERPRPAA